MSASVGPQLLLALGTGLLGGFGHCIGMCGPVVAACSLSDRRGPSPATFIPHLLYHAGRLTTYGLIGVVMGYSGQFLNIAGRMSGLQNAVAVLAGVPMIIMGFTIAGGRSPRWIEQRAGVVLRMARRVSVSASHFRFAVLGLVLGLLPCGLSYTMFLAAAGSGSALGGVMISLLFGLGTVPAMLAFGAFISFLSSRVRGGLYRAGGLAVILMGIWYVWRGMELYARL